MAEFRVTEKRVIKCKPYTSTVELFYAGETGETGLRMAECESYKKWFHSRCEKIPAAVFSARKQCTAQKMKFSVKDLATFTEEILNGILHFLCSAWSCLYCR